MMMTDLAMIIFPSVDTNGRQLRFILTFRAIIGRSVAGRYLVWER